MKVKSNEFYTEIKGEIKLVRVLESGVVEYDDFMKGVCRTLRSKSELFKTKKEAVIYFK